MRNAPAKASATGTLEYANAFQVTLGQLASEVRTSPGDSTVRLFTLLLLPSVQLRALMIAQVVVFAARSPKLRQVR
jgi:hypothetical protein